MASKSDGVRALVMELVEGPTLADRLAQGALPVDEALPIAKQIAEALEAAHEQGIVHRDLKPANIKVREDGTVKVLDFGLAKALETAPHPSDASQSPTITSPAMTRMGVILGTAAYMSPEQARGKSVDKRVDIWAFGCVLYEMLTGRRAFLEKTPRRFWPLSSRPNRTGKHCRPTRPERFDDCCVGAYRRTANSACTISATRELRYRMRRRKPLWFRLSLVAGASGWRGRWRLSRLGWPYLPRQHLRSCTWGRPAPQPRPVTFPVAPPETMTFDLGFPLPQLSVSPDGTRLVFTVRDKSDVIRLWERPLHALSGHLLTGTEGANNPFWSPDSRFIGFFANGKLKKIAVDGGLPQTLCDALTAGAGTWNRDGVILFSGREGMPIQRVSAGGDGAVTAVTKLDQSRGERTHFFPHFLPDGKRFLYLAQSTPAPSSRAAST